MIGYKKLFLCTVFCCTNVLWSEQHLTEPFFVCNHLPWSISIKSLWLVNRERLHTEEVTIKPAQSQQYAQKLFRHNESWELLKLYVFADYDADASPIVIDSFSPRLSFYLQKEGPFIILKHNNAEIARMRSYL